MKAFAPYFIVDKKNGDFLTRGPKVFVMSSTFENAITVSLNKIDSFDSEKIYDLRILGSGLQIPNQLFFLFRPMEKNGLAQYLIQDSQICMQLIH